MKVLIKLYQWSAVTDWAVVSLFSSAPLKMLYMHYFHLWDGFCVLYIFCLEFMHPLSFPLLALKLIARRSPDFPEHAKNLRTPDSKNIHELGE